MVFSKKNKAMGSHGTWRLIIVSPLSPLEMAVSCYGGAPRVLIGHDIPNAITSRWDSCPIPHPTCNQVCQVYWDVMNWELQDSYPNRGLKNTRLGCYSIYMGRLSISSIIIMRYTWKIFGNTMHHLILDHVIQRNIQVTSYSCWMLLVWKERSSGHGDRTGTW